MAEEGHLPPRDNGRTEVSAPMEHGTPSEILSVEIMVDDSPYFPVYLFLLVFLFDFASFLLFGQVFATIVFSTLLSPTSQVLFYNFKFYGRTFKLSYVLLLL